MVEGFPIIAQESKTITGPENLFDENLTFTDVPAGFARNIIVSLYVGTNAAIWIRLNNVNYAINNGAVIQGAIVFNLLVTSSDVMNITTTSSNILVNARVCGA